MKTQINTDTPMMKDCPSTPCSPSSEYTGTLRIGEPHPSAREALRHVAELGYMRQLTLMESFSSCAIEGNRLAEVCVETLRRVMYCEPVSDRYILGLAWAIRSMDFSENVEVKRGAEVSAKDATSPPSLLPSCCASSFEGGGK